MTEICDEAFDKIDFKTTVLAHKEYVNCTFKKCDFSNVVLSELRFIECEFVTCNLSLTDLFKASLIDVVFTDSKLLGLQFDKCNQFGLSFKLNDCFLQHCSFYRTILKKSVFSNSKFWEVDFTECDLTNAVFNNCDFKKSTFENTILEKADFSTCINYSINPNANKIKKAKFSLPSVVGLLDYLDIKID